MMKTRQFAFLLYFLVVSSYMAYGETLPSFKGVCTIVESIDLKGETIILEDGVSLRFKENAGFYNGSIITKGSLEIRGGYFENISINSNGKLIVVDSRFYCPNVNVVIYRPPFQKNYDKIQIKNCIFDEVGTKAGNQSNSIAAVYLQDVNGLLIEKCSFNNVGNIETPDASAIIVGTAAAESKYSQRIPNKDIVIRRSRFANVNTRPSITYNSGEEHFIIIEGANNVRVENNDFYNRNDILEYDNEFVYTKCDNVFITNNTMRGECGGEGFICCKPYRFAGRTNITHTDIKNNDIDGDGFTICTHYGAGKISGNNFTNNYTGFILCIKKTAEVIPTALGDTEKYDQIKISNNSIRSICTVANIPYYTASQRAAIHMDCAQDDCCNNNVIFKNNRILIEGSIFSSFINLRDYRYSTFHCVGNKAEYKGNSPLRFVSLHIVSKTLNERKSAELDIKRNTLDGIEADVYVPDNALVKDELRVKASNRERIIDNRMQVRRN